MRRVATIHLASILLEPQRWRPGRPASIRASEWSARAAAAGFDGWELFENHHRLAAADERERLREGPLPVRIFNSYEAFDDPARPTLRQALEAARRLGAKGMKFNVGADLAALPRARECITAVAAEWGDAPRLLCECHPGTALEDPACVSEFLQAWPVAPFDVIVHPFLIGPAGIARWCSLLGSHVRHAHVQMRASNDARRFLELGDDAPRARECLAALADCGFRGTFSLEFTRPTGRPDDVPETLFASAVRDLEFLRMHWKG